MAKRSKKAETKVVEPKKEVIKEVSPSIEEVSEAKAEKKEDSVYDEVRKPIDPPLIEVEEEDLTKYEPDTIDEFAVFTKAKSEDKGQVWVKDHTLLKKVEGRQYTLSGTQYLGELKSND